MRGKVIMLYFYSKLNLLNIMSNGIEHHLHTETVEKLQKFVKDIKLAGRGMKGETSSKKGKTNGTM